ncbi:MULTISPECIES: hypothetical protein [Chryseobacterium]|uniref:Uncharacterized protein n=1 Tax=Chryseobacterium oleae TaxID=491207 RepID=A0A1I4ZNZ7_CHROL|nr:MULTISPECIES: hypothetical protein [Chryseobacterium]SFN51942.1 hypothetical protein SAMN05421594_3128 [Chryseobacterium oleae]SHG49375.1 hypothetical protein SAMN02787100_4240 [Chryseobacterium sp. OV279]
MDLQTIAMDSYQSSMIMAIKLNALIASLTDEQKVIYQDSINEQIAEITKKLENKMNTEEVLEILRSMNKM